MYPSLWSWYTPLIYQASLSVVTTKNLSSFHHFKLDNKKRNSKKREVCKTNILIFIWNFKSGMLYLYTYFMSFHSCLYFLILQVCLPHYLLGQAFITMTKSKNKLIINIVSHPLFPGLKQTPWNLRVN